LDAANLEDQLKEAQRRLAELQQEVHRLHAELRAKVERFDELVEHLHQVFWIVEARTDRLLYISPAYEKIWGRTCQSLYENNRSWVDVIHPDDRERVASVVAQKHDTGQYGNEYRITRPDGSIRWIWDRGYAVRDGQGNITRFVGVAEDITERKEAEEQSARLAAIIEYAEDAIVSITLQGIVISWNPGAERLYGYSAEEMIGHSIMILHPPEKQAEYQTLMKRLRRGERVASFETVRRRKDGTLIDVSISAAPIDVSPSQVPGVSKIAHDISKIKRLERQFHQAQKMEAIGTLAGGVAHDFNNLLTVISGYSDILISRLKPDDPMRESLAQIHKAGERAGMLTRQLLAFSRQQVLAPMVLDINSVVADTERMLRRLIGEDIMLTAVLEPALGPVKADPGQLEQVLMNLAVNARDAMPQGGMLTIETRSLTLAEDYADMHPHVQPGDYVMLAVSDTGAGMDETTKARIFEPFFTTKEQGKGTGLGLAVVHGIVKQSGGHIEVYSELGKGTSFKVYLPLVKEPLPTRKSSPSLLTMPQGKETVLLVEDEDAVRELARHALQSCGYSVLEASDGLQAVQAARDHKGPIDLLVSDVVMPHLGGRQLAERLAAVRPGMKVLFLSGYTADAVIRHGVLEADYAFLQKPFTPTSLAKKVRDVLDAKASGGQKSGPGLSG